MMDQLDRFGEHESKDMVNHPPHYKDRVPGIECIEVTKHFKFTTGNAIKYIWRAGLKGDTVEDLKKAIWYLEQEIRDLQSVSGTESQ